MQIRKIVMVNGPCDTCTAPKLKNCLEIELVKLHLVGSYFLNSSKKLYYSTNNICSHSFIRKGEGSLRIPSYGIIISSPDRTP